MHGNVYITTVGVAWLNKINSIICPKCNQTLVVERFGFKGHDEGCEYNYRLREGELIKINQFVNSMPIDQIDLSDCSEIKVMNATATNQTLTRNPDKVYLISSTTFDGFLAGKLLEKYLKNKNVSVELLYSNFEAGKKIHHTFTLSEVEEIIIEKLLPRIKGDIMKHTIHINLTAGDRSFYPYYLYISSWYRSNGSIEGEVNKVRCYLSYLEGQTKEWIPFPVHKLTENEFGDLLDIFKKFYDEETGDLISIDERTYKNIQKRGAIVKEWIEDGIEVCNMKPVKYKLNLRGKLLYKLLSD